MMKKLLLIAVLASTAQAGPKFNLKDYKTVSVQPVLGARGMASGDLAASVDVDAKADPAFGKLRGSLTDGKGFGFAGKATAVDKILLGFGAKAGLLPYGMKIDPTHTKDEIAGLRDMLGKLGSKLDPKVKAAFEAVLAAADTDNFQETAKLLLDAMMSAAESITKGNERVGAYTAIGVWIGLAAMWSGMGKQSPELASLATPLARMLEEDAVMGGMDRGLATQLKAIAEVLQSPSPTLNAMTPAITAIGQLKPD